jgi:AraC-like DNA-binding protein
MAVTDICAEIAALLIPIPSRADQDDDAYDHMAEEAREERESLAESLRLSWQEEGDDPLLSTLAGLRQQRLRLEADMRLLMAYGRRFTHPRPYKLIDLANAAGMSISGVRIAFDDDEITQAAEILRRPPGRR